MTGIVPSSMHGHDIHRLFVYGSLQPGGSNAHVLAAVDGQWEPAVIAGKLVDGGWGAKLGYLGLVLDEQGDSVDGYLLSSLELGDLWDQLDAFEGREYARVVASVRRPSGDTVDAFVYVLRADPR